MEFTKKVYSTRYDSSVPVYVGNDCTGADELYHQGETG